MKKVLIILIILVAVIVGGVLAYQYWWMFREDAPPLVGGDRDEHGCIGSAGYSWCEAKNKCLRIWEEACDSGAQLEVQRILADKYQKALSEVAVTVIRSDGSRAAGSVKFGEGGLGEGGMFLAIKTDGKWEVIWDGNGSIDCAKMKQQYQFSDEMLRPEFCD